jgi:hypothetical protein
VTALDEHERAERADDQALPPRTGGGVVVGEEVEARLRRQLTQEHEAVEPGAMVGDDEVWPAARRDPDDPWTEHDAHRDAQRRTEKARPGRHPRAIGHEVRA